MGAARYESDPDSDYELSSGERGPGKLIKACKFKAHRAVCLMNQLTALLVDDDWTCQTVIKAQLRYFGVEAQVVSNGQSAIGLLADGARFDLIIVDKHLFNRVMDGLETPRQIRAMGIGCRGCRMVGVQDDDLNGRDFVDAGVDKCTQKSLGFDWLAGLLLEVDILQLKQDLP